MKGVLFSTEAIRKDYLFCHKQCIKGEGLDHGVEPPNDRLDLLWFGRAWLSCCAITVLVSAEKLFVSTVIFPWITKPKAAQINKTFHFTRKLFFSYLLIYLELRNLAVEEPVRYA